MPMNWAFNCFLGFNISPSPPPKWLLNLESWRPKKKDQVARIGVMGGGFRWFGQCPKENVFFQLMSSLIISINNTEKYQDKINLSSEACITISANISVCLLCPGPIPQNLKVRWLTLMRAFSNASWCNINYCVKSSLANECCDWGFWSM